MPLAIRKPPHLAGPKPVHPAIAGKQHALKARQALGKIVRRGPFAEGGFKEDGVFLLCSQPLHGAFDGPAHFTRTFNGPKRLAFQRRFASIPKEARSIGSVPKRWRVAMHVLALDADCQARLPGQAMSWIVTTGARNSAIRGEDWIEEEPTT